MRLLMDFQSITSASFPPFPLTQALSYWGVFAIGFITRPLGAVVFGHIADVSSRKTSLIISILLMAISTTLIGCLPTYATMVRSHFRTNHLFILPLI